MIIGIIGVGFVGDALLYSFQQKNIEVKIYDKYKNGGIGRLEDILLCDLAFLCLPTLFCEQKNQYDLTSLREVCDFLGSQSYQGLVVVKSTVEPGTCEQLAEQYRLPVVHNPEFLTARTAREDFEQQTQVVLGRTQRVIDLQFEQLMSFYQQWYPKANISSCSAGESESMKLFVNSFYAVKVQMFNEFYLLCQKQENNYQRVIDMMLKNGWINPMHTQVPGPDGKLSYGGACFPKDTRALLEVMYRENSPCQVLKACVEERDQMRSD